MLCPGSEAGFFWICGVRRSLCWDSAASYGDEYHDLEGVTAVIEYEYEGATRFLTKPDPENVPIRFSLHVEAACALFDMLIPIRYKDKTSSKTMNIRISPTLLFLIVAEERVNEQFNA
ncbi:hypothetical protein FOCG_17449 [Fusarium oxysporum f. sp. radicis-lycopersici 26381]|nr:hypothetical protein FOCG_17449 [Fusarium oxysporum f. sp. radicis-lycopersici 26381]